MKRLYRSQTDKKVAGICGGLAEVFNYDPLFVRLVAFILFVETLFLPVTLIYIVLWVILPKGPRVRPPTAG